MSKITLFYAAFIVVCACFIVNFWGYLGSILGKRTVELTALVALGIMACAIVAYEAMHHFNTPKFYTMLLVIGLALLFISKIDIFVEKLHLVEYGLLGWLCMKDLTHKHVIYKNIIYTLLFTSLISALDEGFQRFLPGRVGQLSDVMLNLASGGFGIAAFILKEG